MWENRVDTKKAKISLEGSGIEGLAAAESFVMCGEGGRGVRNED